MRNLITSEQSYTGLVQKYIGSAYDLVRLVGLHIPEVAAVAAALERGDLDELDKLLPKLDELLRSLVTFKNGYYGVFDKEPTERPDGTPSQTGDIYFNTVADGLHVFEGGVWTPMGATGALLEVHEIDASHFHNGVAVVNLTNGYAPHTHNLVVFVNATFQYPLSALTPNGAYIEQDSNTIVFPQDTLEEDDVVTVLIGNIVTSVEHVVSVTTESYQTGKPGEKTILLPGNMSYAMGVHNLEVYVDGILQQLSLDYVETDPHHVTFIHALPQGSVVLFKQGHIISNSAGNTAYDASAFQILSVMGEFHIRGKVLAENSVVILLGYHNINDGGGGVFTYAPLYDRRGANGGTVIDVNVDLDHQGHGTGNGCWIRQYANVIETQWYGIADALVREMPLLGRVNDNDILDVIGYHTEGDGGEGRFYWDADCPKTMHDGGLYIDPLVQFPVNWNNVLQMGAWYTPSVMGKGCWVRLNQDAATIDWFGAIGDDSTDNSHVFAGIGKSIMHGNVTNLRVPAGDYQLSGPGFLYVDTLPAAFRMYGTGHRSRIISMAGSADRPIQFVMSNYVQIENISFHSRDAGRSNSALVFQNCRNVNIEKCYFRQFGCAAFLLEEDTARNIARTCHHITFVDNEIWSCGTQGPTAAIEVSPKKLSRDTEIRDNYFDSCGAPTVPVIRVGVALDNARINDNFLVRSKGPGISIRAYENISVFNNTINMEQATVGLHGIEVFVDSDAVYHTPGLEFCEIRDNLFEGPDVGSTVVPTYAVHIEGTLNNLESAPGVMESTGVLALFENTFKRLPGIQAQPQAAIRNLAIERNQFHKVPANFEAIRLDASKGNAPARPAVNHNHIYCTDTGRSNAALILLDGCKSPVVQDNFLQGSGKWDLELKSCPGAQVLGNTFFEPNLGNITGHACVNITDNLAVDYFIESNRVQKGLHGYPKALFAVNSMLPQIQVSNNYLDYLGMHVTEGMANVTGGGQDTILQFGLVRHFYGLTPPITGSFNVGDITWNTGPAAAGHVGWACIGAGAPGTWKPFGKIEP